MQGRTAALCNSFDDSGAIAESRAEKDVRVHEQTLFERRPAAEPCAEERADILRARGRVLRRSRPGCTSAQA